MNRAFFAIVALAFTQAVSAAGQASAQSAPTTLQGRPRSDDPISSPLV